MVCNAPRLSRYCWRTSARRLAPLLILRDAGVQINTGTVARMLLDADGFWADEAAAVHQTGLVTGSWVATDQTSTRVDGQNEVCHVVSNSWFTSYHTRPGGTRQMC